MPLAPTKIFFVAAFDVVVGTWVVAVGAWVVVELPGTVDVALLNDV